MTEARAASPLPLVMGSALEFVVRECHCDENRAKKLLSINNNDPLKAVRHQQKLSAMLRRQGHSGAQSRLLIPAPDGNDLPSYHHDPPPPTMYRGLDDSSVEIAANGSSMHNNLHPSGNDPERALPPPDSDTGGNQPMPDLSTPNAVVTTASTLVGLAEPRLEMQSEVPSDREDAEKPRAWDFQLPKLPEVEAIDILLAVAQPFGTMEGDEAKFNLRELCAAMQQGADLLTIKRYLQGFPDAVVRHRINGTVEGIPSIFYVIKTNDPVLLRLWASYGADPSAIHQDTGTPLLAYAIVLSELLGGRNTSPIVATLLSLGASPASIPDVFYKSYNRDLSEDALLRDVDGLDKSPKKEWQWCQAPSVRSNLARTIHLTQRYYLDRAAKLPRAGTRHRQIATLRNAEAILGIPYYLIGQTVAANHLLRKMMTFITVPSKKPLVLAFAGPSGHGKTELARKLGDLLGLSLQVVDCTIFNDERELFGPRAPYVGSDRGSPLNNFVAQHAGQRCIVFLDEFEKTSKAIHQSLLLPFDNGEYQDRRSLATVDCSRTIWILATNALDETILQFCDANPAILQHDAGNGVDIDHAMSQRLVKTLSMNLRTEFLGRFGAPVTGRVSDFIPFLPFSKGEQGVVVHKFLLELAERVAAPVRLQLGTEEQLLGNVRLRVRRDASVCMRLAKAEYSEELGARSLRKAVEDVQDRLVESYLDDEREIEEGELVQPTAFVVDVRADEVVVHKCDGSKEGG